MLSSFRLAEDDTVPFLQRVRGSWEEEMRKYARPHGLEYKVGMGYNLVPWQLGPLEIVRNPNNQDIRNTFAIAYDLLSRRCVTVPRDFFHALLGVLGKCRL